MTGMTLGSSIPKRREFEMNTLLGQSCSSKIIIFVSLLLQGSSLLDERNLNSEGLIVGTLAVSPFLAIQIDPHS